MDGLTAVRRIREMEREGKFRSHVPIIAVTANARPEHVNGALEAGMDDVCTKPFSISEIMEKMKFWIGEVAARMAVDADREEFAGG
jgi:CheY-like chemotaxis protein